MKVELSSGNVFRELGFGFKEAESLRLRAELMVELKRLIQVRKLNAEFGGQTLRSYPAARE